ncbi:MAG: hypothetical protein RLZZ52_178 [Actinomycetota bacterium]
MSSSLEISKRLRALSDDQLIELVTIRLGTTGSLRDYFDLADALLAQDSITAALRRLPAHQLLELRALTEGSPLSDQGIAVIIESALLGPAETPPALYPEVSAVLHELTSSLKATPATAAQKKSTTDQTRDTAALEHSLAVITSLDELARSIAHHPVKELARGGLSAQDSARLAPLMPSPTLTPTALLALAQLAGVLVKNGGWWISTIELEAWLALPLTQRWLTVAKAWSQELGPDVTSVLTAQHNWGPELNSWLDAQYPLGHAWLDADLSARLSEAELMGLCTHGNVTAVGSHVLAGNWEDVVTAITAVVPPFAEHVFVQHDFTVVAPGPLRPVEDVFMRQLCTVESRGLATTFRITAQGVNRLLAQGVTAEDILQRLNNLAATDIPQAVSYFITDLGERFGSIQVTEKNGLTIVTAVDPLVLRSIAADHSLHALSLRPHEQNSLFCAHPAQVVHAALIEAKYPAQLVDANGTFIQPEGRHSRAELHAEPANPYTALIERLRGSREAATTDDATWIARQLDVAVREKSILIVTVQMPDGARDFTIEPKGFSNGRLRCLDRTTEVERTLPASHITAVRPA